MYSSSVISSVCDSHGCSLLPILHSGLHSQLRGRNLRRGQRSFHHCPCLWRKAGRLDFTAGVTAGMPAPHRPQITAAEWSISGELSASRRTSCFLRPQKRSINGHLLRSQCLKMASCLTQGPCRQPNAARIGVPVCFIYLSCQIAQPDNRHRISLLFSPFRYPVVDYRDGDDLVVWAKSAALEMIV